MSGHHEPVLLEETLHHLLHGPGLYLDATLGDGGHALALLEREPAARLLGCDRDPDALAIAGRRLARFGDRVTLAHATFRELEGAHRRLDAELLAGALFDLGVSSRQIDDRARGMSFTHDGPLDLRMDPSRGESAAERLLDIDEVELAGILREHGDVRGAMRIARAIVAAARAGRLGGTAALASTVAGAVGGRSHPRLLAQVFQAIRIWINDEAGELEAALEWLPRAMRPGGVVVTLAYHSGEDRRIKQAIRAPRETTPARRRPPTLEERLPEGPWHALTSKVVTPSPGETPATRVHAARGCGPSPPVSYTHLTLPTILRV